MQWSDVIISAVRMNGDLLKVFSVSLPEEYERPGKELIERDTLVHTTLTFSPLALILPESLPFAAQSMP